MWGILVPNLKCALVENIEQSFCKLTQMAINTNMDWELE